jgi:hypothetical protein
VQGFAWDLERNYRVAVEVQRRIVTKTGRRYSEDMIVVTANAAQAIAFRNAVFRCIPFAYVRSAYDRAKVVSLGEDIPHSARVAKAMDTFGSMGAAEADVLAALGRGGRDDVTLDDLVTLRGWATAIRDGDVSLAECLGRALQAGRAEERI